LAGSPARNYYFKANTFWRIFILIDQLSPEFGNDFLLWIGVTPRMLGDDVVYPLVPAVSN